MGQRAAVLSIVACLGAGVALWTTVPRHTIAPAHDDVTSYAAGLVERNYRVDAPGAAILVAQGDAVLFRSARGLADVERRVPLGADSVFRIGSITKQFVAAGLLTLVEAGKVSLDDPLSKYVSDFPGGNGISVRQLLNHTSGVMSYSRLPGYVDQTIRRDMTTAELIDLFKSQRPDFAPGTKWAYSNSGYVLVGAIIEVASGEPWHAYLDRKLFKPLGMRHTGYGHASSFAEQQVRGYSYEGDNVVPMRRMSMTQPHAAGGLVSNVDDLLKWNRALHEGRVLKRATYLQMITPADKAADPTIKYGFGLFSDTIRGAKVLQHGGHIFGFMASLSYLPGPDITVVVLENDDARNSSETPETLARKLAATVLGHPYPEMRALPVDQAALQSAEGVYRFAANTVRILRLVDRQLTAQRDAGLPAPLTPIATDDFLYPDGFNRLKLERGADGGVMAIRFFPNGDGDGEQGVRTREPLPAATLAIRLPHAALERLTGTYVNGGLTMKVYIDGAGLKAQIDGQPPATLRATSATTFDVLETGATLDFPPGGGPAPHVTIRQNGREITLRRMG